MILAAAAIVSACASAAQLPVSAGFGSEPTLPPPETSPIPLVKVATARGWPDGQRPIAADGTTVTAFAQGLEHPRWIYVLPNGDVLVAETNGPERPEDNKGIRGKVFKHYYAKAGSAVPSANRITLLRDADGDGVAEMRSIFASGLNSPFGMALVGDVLYVADSDALVKLPYSKGQTQVTTSPVKVTDLPAGPINHHWTKNVIANADGSKLYVAIGSNSNVGENGIAAEEGRLKLGDKYEPDVGIFLVAVKVVLTALIQCHHIAAQAGRLS